MSTRLEARNDAGDTPLQIAVKYGGILLAISVIGSLYLVLRFREVYRSRVQVDLRVQQLVVRQQALEGLLREFIPRAANDHKVAEILQRYQIIGGAPPAATNQGQELKR